MECTNLKINLNNDWFFHLGEVERFEKLDHNTCYLLCKAGTAMGTEAVFREKNDWKRVVVPHDWLAEIAPDKNGVPSIGYKKRGSAWYYRTLTLDNTTEYAELIFDGILGECEVYVNGTLAARNFSGYNRFSLEAANYLVKGENIIAVHVNAEKSEGWWYEGAGIYRNVTLRLCEKYHFVPADCFVRGEKRDGKWCLCGDLKATDGVADSRLIDADGNEVFAIKGNTIEVSLDSVKEWTPDKPYLYTFESTLYKYGKAYDTFTSTVGFRTIEWNPNRGMFLNGEKTRIKGVCCHQDHAGVGAAVGKTLPEYRLKKLKALGVNAYRTAHHAPSEDFLDICDRLGMLVMVENRHFNTSKETIAELEALVKLSRNHPSVFLYSLFNEEPWQEEERGLKIARELRERVLAHDSTRAVTGAMNTGLLEETNASRVLDVIGINYAIKDYEKCHEQNPDKAIIGTENAVTFATRGIYESDKEKQVWACYGDDWASAFSESLDETMKAYFNHSFNAGCFVWSGFDYRGETNPYEWPSVSSHWGLMDLCGFEKDTAYHLAGYYKKELFVHIAPHWNHEDGKVRVCVFTNGHAVDIYTDEHLVASGTPINHRAEFNISFEWGSIRARAYGDGKYADCKVWTAEEFSHLAFEVTEGEDMRIIDVCAVDRKGHLIPDFCEVMEISGDVIGIGNGNPNSHHIDTDCKIELFNGKAQIIARGKIKISCNGFEAEV